MIRLHSLWSRIDRFLVASSGCHDRQGPLGGMKGRPRHRGTAAERPLFLEESIDAESVRRAGYNYNI